MMSRLSDGSLFFENKNFIEIHLAWLCQRQWKREEGAQTFRRGSPFFGFHVGHHVGQMVKMMADMMADMKIMKKPRKHGFSCSTESSWPT
jgi:hypothetical protein